MFSLLFSKMAFAFLIEHNGYMLDTDTNVVTGGDFEWLRWDQTLGNSFDQALLDYSGGNWRIAHPTEMSGLVTAFNGQSDNVKAFEFGELFGFTQVDDLVYQENRVSKAFYEHESSIFHANWASFTTIFVEQNIDNQFFMDDSDPSPQNWDVAHKNPNWGVALVRGVESVPETASGVLTGVALLGMLLFRRKSKVGLYSPQSGSSFKLPFAHTKPSRLKSPRLP